MDVSVGHVHQSMGHGVCAGQYSISVFVDYYVCVVFVWPLVLGVSCAGRCAGVVCGVCQSEAMVGVLFRGRGSWAPGPM